MNNLYLGFKFAISYFTILPVRFKQSDDLSKKEILDKMILTLPLIGLIIGSLTVLLYSFLDSIPWLASIISVSIYMILYGFIHTEAVLDVVDAIYAKHGGKDPYIVIKDPTIGAMGLLYALILVFLKLTVISYMFVNNLHFEFLAIVVISRICIQYLIYFNTFRSSFITQLRASMQLNSFLSSLLVFSFIIVLLTNANFLVLLLVAFIISTLIFKSIKKNVGFLNGDALGTNLELIEVILAVLVCYLWL